MNLDPSPLDQLTLDEGWHVLHVFYHVDHANWSVLSDPEQLQAKTDLTLLAQEIRTHPETQLIVCSVVSPKADIGCVLITPDLQDLNEFEKRLTQSLGPDILTPVFSHVSMTTGDPYLETTEEHGNALVKTGLAEGSNAYRNAIAEFEKRIERTEKDRLYPQLPDWPVFGFYSYCMRRATEANWFTLGESKQRQLMNSESETRREFNGKVKQLTTASIGLDDAEWAVTLFALNSAELNSLVTRLRSNEASAVYAEFGEFYLGIQLPLDELFRRVGI
ncbi:MAG: chlorite dismutase family protein [Verrucomicrobiota bacterium]